MYELTPDEIEEWDRRASPGAPNGMSCTLNTQLLRSSR